MNASLRLLVPVLTLALIASLNATTATVAAQQAPIGARTATIAATTPAAPASSTRIAAPSTASPTRVSPATTVSGISCSPSCDLWAKTGSLTLPDGTSAPIWGYAANAADAATIPGPTLLATEGTALSITLHNVSIPSATSLTFPGTTAIPDITGVAAGGSVAYTFAAGIPAGTYLYEAGLTNDGASQVAMGLFGALVVRPTVPAYDDEALVVLSEIDPAFNAAPTTFSLQDFAPKYWLINGKGYPNTDPIASAPGSRVLLRYVNAGLMHHSMTLVGLHQTIVAVDANVSTNPSRVVAFTVPAGGTADTITTIPATAPAGAKYALFDAAPRLDNSGRPATPAATNPAYTPIAFGGMLTFLTTTTGASGTTGPATTNVTLTPNVSAGTAMVALAATVGPTATIAEYFVDALGANGSGCPMTVSAGSATSTIVTSGAALPCTYLGALSSGTHTFYVHASDGTNWGAVGSAHLTLDKAGPTISSIAITKTPTNGTADVTLQATASDAATGGQNVDLAEYDIDTLATSGTGTAMTVSAPTTTVSLTATVPAATVTALAEGPHTIYILAHDVLGNWGPAGTATLVVDKTGPVASAVVTTPNPTNGTFGVQGSTGSYEQLLTATLTDATSTVAAAEYFLDAPCVTGTGALMLPADGVFNSAVEAVTQLVNPLPAIATLSQGQHTLSVHGQDAAGNWGACGTVALIIDKTGPDVTGGAVSPNPAAGVATVTLTATATDPANTGTPLSGPASNVIAAEWFIGTDPGQGQASAITITTPAPSVTLSATIDVSTLRGGTYIVSVRAQDAAHNWGPLTNVSFAIAPTVSAVSPATGPTVGGTTITITGSAFGPGASVLVGGETASNVAVLSSTSITALTPVHNPGLVDVLVTVGGQTSAISAADNFTYTGPTPAAPVGGAGPAAAPGAPAPGAPAAAVPAAPASGPLSTLALRPRPAGLQPAPFRTLGPDAYHAQWFGQSAYPTAAPGQLLEWVVAFRNTGRAGWYRGILGANAALGSSEPLNNEAAAQMGMDPGNWQYPSRFSVQTTDYVAPGQVGWFVIQIKAPTIPGTYRLHLRPVIDGTSWMEDYGVYVDITVQ